MDAIAGLTLWGLVVPEAMAYAGIAGLPPQAGLYTLVASLLVYALLGTSRHLSVGGTSATAALLASSVAAALVASASATASDPQTYADLRRRPSCWSPGLVFLVAGIARLGFITQFLSKPVMDGFVVGLAIFVAVGQLNKLFGVAKPEGNTVEKLIGIIRELPEAEPARRSSSGAAALAALFLAAPAEQEDPGRAGRALRGHRPELGARPGGTAAWQSSARCPQGLPAPAARRWSRSRTTSAMVLPAIGVLLVAFSESLGVAHEFAEKHGYEVDADQELNAHAVVNLGSAPVRRDARRGRHVGRRRSRRARARARRSPTSSPGSRRS